MTFLYFLEKIRTPVLDLLFSIVTLFGEETVFMAVGMIVFWCVNKHKGYYLLSVGFVGTVINQFLTKQTAGSILRSINMHIRRGAG